MGALGSGWTGTEPRTPNPERRGIWVGALSLGLIGLVLFGPGAVWLIRMEFKQRRLDRQLAELKATREQLAAEEARLRSDPAYVEGLIRTTFKFAKPGELVIPLEPQPSHSRKPVPVTSNQ